MASDGTWEAAVRQVTLPGRVDDIHAMKRPWTALFDELVGVRRQAADLQANMTTQWKGPAATEFARKAKQIVDRIDQLRQEYSTVLDRLDTQANALSEAKKAIPIPNLGGQLPGGREDDGTGGRLYDDFGDHPQRYADFEHLAYRYLMSFNTPGTDAEANLGEHGASSGTSTDDWTVDVRGRQQATPGNRRAKDAAVAAYCREVARTWYDNNKQVASAAFDNLRTDWDNETHHMPTPSGNTSVDKTKTAPERHHDNGGGGSDAAGLGGGAGGLGGGMSLGAGGSAAPGRYQLHFGSGRGPATVPESGGVSSLAGTGTSVPPATADGVVGSGAGYAAGPTTGSGGAAGSGGVGGFGIGASGIGVRGGGTPTPTGRPTASEPVGPRSDVREYLPGQKGAVAASRAVNGATGMMPPGAGGNRSDREERQTWLIEDDEDIWQPKERPSHTGLIE
ncbi:MAG TPA: hypothetical protein VGN37_29975 [Actinocatenispora sp.]